MSNFGKFLGVKFAGICLAEANFTEKRWPRVFILRIDNRPKRPRSARWSRRWRLGEAVPAPFEARWRRVQALQLQGRTGDAYRLAVATARWATSRGNEVAARRISAVITELQLTMPDSTCSFRGVEALEDALRRAWRADRWLDALDLVNAILVEPDLSLGARRRALTNRAAILVTLGRFVEAIKALDDVKADSEAWQSIEPRRRMAVRLARLAALQYVEGPRAESVRAIQKAASDVGRSPSLWQLYWWIMGHAAWNQAERLESVRRASLRTFNPDWDRTIDRLFWGMDLQTGWHANRPYFERRLSMALDEPQTLAALGRSGWMDLKADWLRTLIHQRAKEAPDLWEEHVAWCEINHYDGWARYWQAHPPEN